MYTRIDFTLSSRINNLYTQRGRKQKLGRLLTYVLLALDRSK